MKDSDIRKAFRHMLNGVDGDIIRTELEYYTKRRSHVTGDSHATAFNDGQRMLAQNILSMADDDDDFIIKEK